MFIILYFVDFIFALLYLLSLYRLLPLALLWISISRVLHHTYFWIIFICRYSLSNPEKSNTSSCVIDFLDFLRNPPPLPQNSPLRGFLLLGVK